MNPSNHSQATWLRRVEALLAQAASTDYPDEAETFLAKAQELMARHAIDESMLGGGAPGSSVISESVTVEPPYASARATLLARVARANGCRVVLCSGGRGAQRCALIGRSTDVERTRLMFAALSLHATRTMLGAAVPPGDTPRRFRHAFLLSFAMRIGQRLQEAAARAEQAAEASTGRSVALVLARRTQEVDDAVRAAFPLVSTWRSTASSSAGFQQGRVAADGADLHARVASGGPRGLRAG